MKEHQAKITNFLKATYGARSLDETLANDAGPLNPQVDDDTQQGAIMGDGGQLTAWAGDFRTPNITISDRGGQQTKHNFYQLNRS